MRILRQKPPAGTPTGQRGFTLIELLVVIGIIVALAGITVPLVTRFTGSGKTGAMVTESEAVQTAMNGMMAQQDITTVTALINPVAATNDWTGFPLGAGSQVLYGPPGDRYLKTSTTDYFYCWTAAGDIYTRDVDPEAADDAGACRAPP